MSADLEAERACLGALVEAPELVTMVPRLRARHFSDTRHAAVFEAVLEAEKATGVVPDSLVVLDRLRAAGQLKAGHLDGPFLHDLISAAPTSINVAWYAQQVLDAARRRALLRMAPQVAQAAERSSDDDDLTSRMARILADMEGLAVPQSVTAGGLMLGYSQLGEFVDRDGGHDAAWVIPGLLRSMERVVVVASEGAGKTMIARAVACAVAAGCHPFCPESAIPARRTLMVDLENPPSLIRAKTRPMVEFLRERGTWDDDRAWLWSRPGGINLRSSEDALLLERVIEQSRPQLVCFGPVYKAFVEGGQDRSEQAAREVVAVLDRLREKHGFALWVEHHAPLEQQGSRRLRPFGSALWSRWPEFGLALRIESPSGNRLLVERWRGDRDEREWPSALDRGRHGWPWEASWADGMPDWLRHNWPYGQSA